MNFGGGEKIEETVSNITNEIMVVGSIYRNPDLIVEYSQYKMCIRDRINTSSEWQKCFEEKEA